MSFRTSGRLAACIVQVGLRDLHRLPAVVDIGLLRVLERVWMLVEVFGVVPGVTTGPRRRYKAKKDAGCRSNTARRLPKSGSASSRVQKESPEHVEGPSGLSSDHHLRSGRGTTGGRFPGPISLGAICGASKEPPVPCRVCTLSSPKACCSQIGIDCRCASRQCPQAPILSQADFGAAARAL
jgi:hypothetical protein